MAFVFIIIGIVLLASGVRGTSGDLYTALQKDFSPSAQSPGQHSFAVWAATILIIGALGYVKSFQALSRTFMALVIIVLLLSNSGFFAKFNQFVQGEAA